MIRFISNRADRGGAVVFSDSNIIIEKYSTVNFNNNYAMYSSGGAFVCSNNSNVTIKGNSTVTFHSNEASQNGGAIHLYSMCKIMFMENSTSNFINNNARDNGGAILSSEDTGIIFKGNSMVTFDSNVADNGGTFHITDSIIKFKEASMILFHNNTARQNGGVGYFSLHSKVMFLGITSVKFNNNGALYGGVIFADNSNITIIGNSSLSFVRNEATQDGGAGYFSSHSSFIVKENALLAFNSNEALHGGAVYINNKIMFILLENSTALFYNNTAIIGGGAVSILNYSSITLKDHITMNFTDNSAQYGGAIFLDTTVHLFNNNSDKSGITFTNNFAKFKGDSVYQEVVESCNSSCLSNTIFGISTELIITPPSQLQFYDPAICTDNDNDTQCNNYYVQNIMLGREIILPACVLDYYNNQIVDSTQFLVDSAMHTNYTITGPTQILISCNDTFQGLSITGNETLSTSKNVSINISLNVDHNPGWKQISINLVVGLSPCHPGFWQYPRSKKCECYNANDIVFCSGSSSTIKRGYWFGSVTGKPTVTVCPINYCNFTCCETVNGYYHLSPVRDNQCRSHRSGTACGICEKGYALSFDSVECIHEMKCGTGQMILVLTLILLYWIVIIVAVFSIMHFKVGIGYLYAIMYYYSVIDLILSQNWYLSNGFYTVINVMSSTAKITPQFLGQFCFITNMSGIDQQFIHYIHPVAISLFLVMIIVLARRSHRLSSFISKGIIHVICCLLLLSYTSLATTSLLLLRPLIFHDVDKVYTYVSPGIEYFHGRHLVYAIVAVLFTVVFVIGLPLLLSLEPFLNSKINFIKIKPLLDQFQGCYKDKYRCFAAYYMICRLVIIAIIISNSSNDSIFQYFLIIACVVMALIHQILKPYSNSLFNDFDGTILHFLVLISVLPLMDFFDSFDTNLLVGITCILVILPLLIFVTMSLVINKAKIKKLPGYCYIKYSQLRLRNYDEIPLNEAEELHNEDEYVNVIDDSRRVNATICDM